VSLVPSYGNQQPSKDTDTFLKVQRLEALSSYTSSDVEAQGTLSRGDDIVRSLEKSKAVCYVYKIINSVNDKVYYGITNNLRLRWNAHKCAYFTTNRPLYAAMRKYGIEQFLMVILCVCPDREYAGYLETRLISFDDDTYNLAPGGEGGWFITDKEDWIEKLKKARVGRKPALGMSHTEENKKLFSKVSRDYWADKDTYNPESVASLSFKDAHSKFGISKTHYYRLRRSLGNDQ